MRAPSSGRRVAFVVDSDAWGGAEVYVAHLARRAAPLGWHPVVVCAAPVAASMRSAAPGVPVVDVPLARRASSAPEVRAALEAVRPDVVHVNLVDPASNAAAVRAALAVAPATATLHLHGDCGATPEERRSLAVLYARLGRMLTPARVTKDELVRALGLPGRHVVVVPNGVDVPAGPLPSDDRPGPLVVGALGRLTEQKGFDVLLEAVVRAGAAGHEFRVVVGGEGRDGDRLRAQARGLPVDFSGFVHDVPAFLRSVDLFCLPSRREAMPLALLEAMGHGLPCIATDVGAVRASVGDAAVVIPPDDVAALADALSGLLADGERRAVLADRARARAVAAFDADLMARRTFAVLGRTLPGRPAARELALPAPQGAAV